MRGALAISVMLLFYGLLALQLLHFLILFGLSVPHSLQTHEEMVSLSSSFALFFLFTISYKKSIVLGRLLDLFIATHQVRIESFPL